MRTAAALKNEFVDHPAPPPPSVQIFLHYTKPVQPVDISWKSQPNGLSNIALRSWRPLAVQPHAVAAARELAKAKVAHDAAVAKANTSLQAAMKHLLAEEKRIKEMAATQPIPDHYVDVASVAVVGGKLVSLLSSVAIAIYALTGFAMVHPIIALFVLIGGAAFYSMGRMTQSKHAQTK